MAIRPPAAPGPTATMCPPDPADVFLKPEHRRSPSHASCKNLTPSDVEPAAPIAAAPTSHYRRSNWKRFAVGDDLLRMSESRHPILRQLFTPFYRTRMRGIQRRNAKIEERGR